MTDEERMVVAAGRKAEEMLRSPYWELHSGLLNELIKAKLFGMVGASNGLDGLIRVEYEKGTINGLNLSKTLFQETIDEKDRILKQWQEQGFNEVEENDDVDAREVSVSAP